MIANDAIDSALIELVTRLEALVIDPDGEDLGAINRQVAERQELLDRIQNADTGALSPGLARDLQQRLRAVYDRQQGWEQALMARKNQVSESLGHVAKGRTAVRGYRPDIRRGPQLKVRG